MSIPWPDRLAIEISAYVQVSFEKLKSAHFKF
jgi:hypothetical protein